MTSDIITYAYWTGVVLGCFLGLLGGIYVGWILAVRKFRKNG